MKQVWSRIIMLGILIVSIPRIAAVMAVVEPTLFGWNIGPLTGAGYGLLMELSLFHMFITWTEADRRGRKHANWLLIGCIVMLLMIATVVTPHIWANIVGTSLGTILSANVFGYVWTVLIVIIPAFTAIFLALTEWFSFKEDKSVATGHLPSLSEVVILQLARKPVVYFLQAGEAGNIKVGYTPYLAECLTALQTANSEEVRIVALVPGDKALEQQWHQKLQKSHLREEWFAPKPTTIKHIATIATNATNATEVGTDVPPPLPTPLPPVPVVETLPATNETIIRKLLREDPTLTVTKLAIKAGCSKATASRIRAKVLANENK